MLPHPKRYAELAGNCKRRRIKSRRDNILILYGRGGRDTAIQVKELAQAVNYEKNGIVDSYDPKMFFEPVEPPTTAAPTEVNTNVAEGLGLSSELELPVDE